MNSVLGGLCVQALEACYVQCPHCPAGGGMERQRLLLKWGAFSLSLSEPYLGVILTPGKGVLQLSHIIGVTLRDLRRGFEIFQFW